MNIYKRLISAFFFGLTVPREEETVHKVKVWPVVPFCLQLWHPAVCCSVCAQFSAFPDYFSISINPIKQVCDFYHFSCKRPWVKENIYHMSMREQQENGICNTPHINPLWTTLPSDKILPPFQKISSEFFEICYCLKYIFLR